MVVTLQFDGTLPPESFAAFAAHRAGRLSLAHAVTAQDEGRAVIRVEGPAALIDAFEMACSLGPADCLVLDVTRLEEAA
jgi:hypothetical protein